MKSLRIGLVGHFLHDSGCSKAILGYVRAAKLLGLDLRVSRLSFLDRIVSKQYPLAEIDWRPDFLIIIFESFQYLSESSIIQIERIVPRNQRLVVDQDGKYSNIITIDGDSNHSNIKSRQDWLNLFQRLSDHVVQPAVITPASGANRFLFFGVDTHSIPIEGKLIKKVYDIAYIGNNWYRWGNIVWFITGLSRIREKIGGIALFGKWWSKPLAIHPERTYSDPAFLVRHRVEVHRSVSIEKLEHTMSRAYINPIFIRPVLARLQFLTPRMFETFSAKTVPLLPPNFEYAEKLYGDSINSLFSANDPADKVEYIFTNYKEMVCLVAEVASELKKKHSYEQRLHELVGQF